MKYKNIKITKNPKPIDNMTFIDNILSNSNNNQPEQQSQEDNNKDKILLRKARMSKNKGNKQKNKTIIKTNIESQTPNFG